MFACFVDDLNNLIQYTKVLTVLWLFWKMKPLTVGTLTFIAISDCSQPKVEKH